MTPMELRSQPAKTRERGRKNEVPHSDEPVIDSGPWIEAVDVSTVGPKGDSCFSHTTHTRYVFSQLHGVVMDEVAYSNRPHRSLAV